MRPWIAALLSFVGWGLGFYYAGRTKAAYAAALLSALLGIIIPAAALAYLATTHTIPAAFAGARGRVAIEAVSFGAAAVVAVVAWRVARRFRTARRYGPSRLLGYFAVWAAPILVAVILAFAVRSLWFQPFSIPSSSMEPTISRGDMVIASKPSYGYGRYSFSPFKGPENKTPKPQRLPKRGDVAIFMTDKVKREYRIYRIIGIPGDTIEMRGGQVYLNGSALVRAFEQVKVIGSYRGETTSAQIYRETLPDGISYLTADIGITPLDDFPLTAVPEDSYFLLGDNRDLANDSRYESDLGFVARRSLIGRADLIAKVVPPRGNGAADKP